ncbi:MAG: ABC transporter ATP-binding protein [Bacteroides sp. SM23_62]|nr:MAG: ABC transporter ATP-binding protein [Bacteroides sp. SM23_62]
MEPILNIRQISKHYGRIIAVQDLSIEVGAGHVFGILGPNGSGKTTTLAIITGVISPDNGTYHWYGRSASAAIRKNIGSLIEVPNFYPYLDLVRNLILVARIKNKPIEDIERVLKLTNLWDRRKSRYDTLSLGMKQRLALSAVLLGDPDVLVLDEPANGLDPEGIAEVREIIKSEAKKQKTIILASHILDEVEKVCTHVAVLKKGKSIAQGRVHELLAADDPVVVECDEPDKLKSTLVRAGMSASIEKDGNRLIIVLKSGYGARDINQFAHQQGIVLTHLETRKKSLESQFLELVKQ